MATSADEWRRWLGLCCLGVAAGLLIWGQTLLKTHLRGVGFLFYWFLCFGFTMAAIVIALVDLRAVRQRARNEHRSLMADALKTTQQQADAGAAKPASEPKP